MCPVRRLPACWTGGDRRLSGDGGDELFAELTTDIDGFQRCANGSVGCRPGSGSKEHELLTAIPTAAWDKVFNIVEPAMPSPAAERTLAPSSTGWPVGWALPRRKRCTRFCPLGGMPVTDSSSVTILGIASSIGCIRSTERRIRDPGADARP